uniref:Ammonium_transp domain-containing protein n=1 Tax=Macrostomum lignano TaxID=282301 RepID=A0A1I8F2R6_9PLAT
KSQTASGSKISTVFPRSNRHGYQQLKHRALSTVELTMSGLLARFNGSNQSMNDFFLCTMAIVVYFMQCGFALLRPELSKNVTNILIKNILDSFIGGLAYYLVGYALGFGNPGNRFCGDKYWALSRLPPEKYSHVLFNFMFAATAATIVSGAVAERCEFVGFRRFRSCAPAGSHRCPGCRIILRPRLGRFDPTTGLPREIRGHSVPLVSLGGFILFFGFLAFNGGSQAAIASEGDGQAVALSMKLRFGTWSLLSTINGGLAGMVAICAGCNAVQPWSALVIGLVASLAYLTVSWLVLKLGCDDPLEAVGVHAGGGFVGVIFGGIFSQWRRHPGEPGQALVGAAAILLWSAVLSVLIFGSLRLLRLFRVSEEHESKGLDIPKHGEPAYPLAAYGHGWEENTTSKSTPRGDGSGGGGQQLLRDGQLPEVAAALDRADVHGVGRINAAADVQQALGWAHLASEVIHAPFDAHHATESQPVVSAAAGTGSVQELAGSSAQSGRQPEGRKKDTNITALQAASLVTAPDVAERHFLVFALGSPAQRQLLDAQTELLATVPECQLPRCVNEPSASLPLARNHLVQRVWRVPEHVEPQAEAACGRVSTTGRASLELPAAAPHVTTGDSRVWRSDMTGGRSLGSGQTVRKISLDAVRQAAGQSKRRLLTSLSKANPSTTGSQSSPSQLLRLGTAGQQWLLLLLQLAARSSQLVQRRTGASAEVHGAASVAGGVVEHRLMFGNALVNRELRFARLHSHLLLLLMSVMLRHLDYVGIFNCSPTAAQLWR